MRYRKLLLVIILACLHSAAWAQASNAIPQPNLRLPSLPPAPASTAGQGYRDPLSSAANDAQRFNFSNSAPKDNAPPDQTPIRVIINNGHGPNVNCVPMGPGAGCH
ncbi:hypothetical protein [Dyella sp. C11]|uniref:hypothetical protein n=1 Tax=Dyella sp. C11 TaxID=2126991 RepID=UPI0013005724|nr:hypothetical protein [Dyella sp. C11]